MKKKAFLMAIVTVIVTLAPCFALPAGAVFISGDWKYFLDYTASTKTYTVLIAEYTGKASSVTVPATIEGHEVVMVRHDAFADCPNVTEIKAAKNSKHFSSQGGVLFNKDKTALEIYPTGKSGAYTIPAGVQTIGFHAFENCAKLTSVTLPKSVTYASNAFGNCPKLAVINVNKNSEKYSSIDGVLFDKNKTTLITYPQGKTSASYTIPDSVTVIGSEAFNNCKKITSVKIGSNVTTIGQGAFQDCINLKSITIPKSVTTINNEAFKNCKSLKTVTIPKGVTDIKWGAFNGCSKLTAINVSENNKDYSSVSGALYNKDKTILHACPNGKTGAYTIPDSVKDIAVGAFQGCGKLTSVKIGGGVETIGHHAFAECMSLKTITIPQKVTFIGNKAFFRCENLTSATFKSKKPPVFEISVFDGCYDKLKTIYVPKGAKSAYSEVKELKKYYQITFVEKG